MGTANVLASELNGCEPEFAAPAFDAVSANHRDANNLLYTPVLTCSHCKGTTFASRDGQTGRRYRCTSCDRRADTAMCSCSHHYGAHAAGGCMGVQDDGFLCECNLRGGR